MTSSIERRLLKYIFLLRERSYGTSGTTVLSHYEYLPDGSKLSALAGSVAGYKYRGSFVYSVDSSGNEKLESVACDEGRITVRYSAIGSVSYYDKVLFRDHLGSTRMVMDITLANLAPSIAVLEKIDYTPFGTRVPISSTTNDRWRVGYTSLPYNYTRSRIPDNAPRTSWT